MTVWYKWKELLLVLGCVDISGHFVTLQSKKIIGSDIDIKQVKLCPSVTFFILVAPFSAYDFEFTWFVNELKHEF